MRARVASGLLCIALLGVCVADDNRRPSIADVKATYTDDLMKLKGVVGNGIGEKNKKPCLTIMVKDEAARKYIAKLLASEIDGYPVVVEVTGEFKPR